MIQVIPTKTRNAEEIRYTTTSMLSVLTTSGNQPSIHIFYNEQSSSLKQGLLKNKIQYHLILPHLHRRNSDGRDIQTLKAHFITCICAAERKYPAKKWDYLLPQATLTLHLLPNCRLNPKLSAYAALHGIIDYNNTPLSPLGTRVPVHKKTTNCCTWSPHGTNG